jgi:hypothetical protein
MIKEKLRAIVAAKADQKYAVKMEMDTSAGIGSGLYNNSCHLNAVNAAMDGRAAGVVECIMINGGYATAHYINMLEDGKYKDFTLGWHYSGSDYRFVRHVPYTEWHKISDCLTALKKEMCLCVRRCMILFGMDEYDLC